MDIPSPIGTIRKRLSCRTFDGRPIDGKAKETLREILRSDMGIALCHFELASAELGIAGSWKQANPGFDADAWEYVASWTVD
jgi:hypothetical protein